ncbi:MAG TPA: hypothetical protein VGD63_20600, partial [Steroidobacteraceae bacterium]
GSSVAIKFDLWDNGGEGNNSTGFYTNGASPTVPALDLTPSGVNLHNGNPVRAHITYDGTTLNLTLTDLVTNASFSASTAINIPAVVGANTAYVGFTAGAAAAGANQSILNWTYSSGGSGTGTAPIINDPTGFSSSASLSFVAGAALTSGALQLSSASGGIQANAAWYATPVKVQSFTTDFTFQLTSAAGDGFTFALQNAGATAVGQPGAGLGYQGIGSSVAIKFDLWDNAGEGSNSTGFYTSGASATIPALNLTPSGVNLHNGNPVHAHITYDGTTLSLTLTDLLTGASFSASTAINIPAVVGANTAYVGFTAGTFQAAANQSILNWTYTAP